MSTIERLEQSIDRIHTEVMSANQQAPTSVVGSEALTNQGDMSVDKSTSANKSSDTMTQFPDKHQTSTPSRVNQPNPGLNDQYEVIATPQVDDAKQGFFTDILGRFNKKRKTISPITVQNTDLDISLPEDMSKVADAVFQSVIASMSVMFDEYKFALEKRFSDLEQELRSKVDDEFLSIDGENGDDDYSSDAEIETLKEENKKLSNLLEVTIGRLTRTEKQLDDVKEEVLDLQARSMRDNLVFYNIDESPRGPPENCGRTLSKFLRDEMKINDEDMEKIRFDRVHRMGAKGNGRKRPIVAKFNPSEGKNIVFRHIKHLDKSKKFGVNEQLPRELEERKRQLLPKFKDAKRKDKKPKWSRDKLIVDNKVTKIEKDRVKDVNIDTSEAATNLKVKRAPPKTYNNSTFRGHNVALTDQDDIVPALHAIYADTRVARATHNIYAYRIQSDSGAIEHYEDDGEWGAGRLLLQLLKDHNITNKLVCVTRWYGGTHLGNARFDHIREAALATLQLQPA